MDSSARFSCPTLAGRILGTWEVRMIFIFEVQVKPGASAERYAEAWVRASEIIQRAAGARGTRLHRRIGDSGSLLAIASWDSKAQRDAADGQRDPRVQAILDEQSELVSIRVVGEFEDPEWVVLPDASDAPGEPAPPGRHGDGARRL